ncbi:MAG TPA: hypothetical protein VGP72_03200 [Planctomycetota bacterium]|jgi:predicted transcriptional regulator
MSTVKAQLRSLAKTLPDDCTLEDAIYELYVLQKIERGMEDIRRGNVIPHDTVMREIYRCLGKSNGRRKRAKT